MGMVSSPPLPLKASVLWTQGQLGFVHEDPRYGVSQSWRFRDFYAAVAYPYWLTLALHGYNCLGVMVRGTEGTDCQPILIEE